MLNLPDDHYPIRHQTPDQNRATQPDGSPMPARQVLEPTAWILPTARQCPSATPSALRPAPPCNLASRNVFPGVSYPTGHYGLPLSIGTHSDQRRDAKPVQLILDVFLTKNLPRNWLPDQTYHSDPLDAEAMERTSDTMVPPFQNRTPSKTPPVGSLRRYQ